MSRPTQEQLRELGASLREIDPSTLARDEEGRPVRWFLGSNGTELFVWGEASGPRHLQLVFARVSVEWSAATGLVTGTFLSGSAIAGGRHDPYLLREGARVDVEVARAALVLLTASALEPPLVAPLIRALEEAASSE